MPGHRSRGMGPNVEAGVSPQSRQYGALSTYSTANENTCGGELQPQFYITSPNVLLPKACCSVCKIFNANPFIGGANTFIPVKITPCREGFQTNLSLSYNSLSIGPHETKGIWL